MECNSVAQLRQRELPFYVYVLLVTAKSRPEELVEGLEAGADDVVTKPLDRPGLVARLRAAHELSRWNIICATWLASDPLTGAMNRRTFLRVPDGGMGPSRSLPAGPLVRHDRPRLLQENQRYVYGHAAGDAMLQAVARLLQDSVRVSDMRGPLWRRRILRDVAPDHGRRSRPVGQPRAAGRGQPACPVRRACIER